MSSRPPLVTVDLGNSRVKLRAWPADAARAIQALPRPLAARDLAVDDELAAGVYAFFTQTLGALGGAAGQRGVTLAVLCSVAAPEVEANLTGLLEELTGGRLDVAPELGLRNACRSPETVGRDRLFAARGALELLGGPALVVDAGTCLTVDAVRVEPRPAGGVLGVFLGGAIAPGPALLARALAQGGARLLAIEASLEVAPERAPAVEALGRDTSGALRAGVVVGFRGAARELLAGVAREAGLEDAPVVITGGARGFLRDPLALQGGSGWTQVLGPRAVQEAPDLVHLGLLAAAAGTVPP
jgi:pantothenate kinase type III